MFTKVHPPLLVTVIKDMVGTDEPKASKQVYKCGGFAASFHCLCGHEELAAQLLPLGGTRALLCLLLLPCGTGTT